jgi:glyoxylase-like metal-dependent hydrolase (beta-lactamase superfamily II)
MRIGRYSCRPIDTGGFALDGGAMFGVVPRALWERSAPPDEKNRISMTARALLLEGEGRKILIDTGNGGKGDEKFRSIYRIETPGSGILRALALAGVAVEEITDVVLTHLHFDHAGGATVREGEEIRPTFPNAVYHVQREHWEAAHAPTERDRASFFSENYDPLESAGVIRFAEGNGEILPGLRVELVHGHTSAMQCPIISDGRTTLFYCADLVPMTAHVPLPWIMAYDLRPLVTLEEKRRLMARALEEEWILFFEHDPSVASGRIVRDDKGYRLGSIVDVGS